MPNEPGDQIVGYVVDDDTVRIGNDYYDLAGSVGDSGTNIFEFDEDVSIENMMETLSFGIRNALEDHFDEFGLATPSGSFTIKSINSSTEVEVEEDLSIDDVNPSIYKPFTIEYEVDKFIELEGNENEEKDLIIGELEYIKEIYEDRLARLNAISKILAEKLGGLVGEKYLDLANIDNLLLDKESTVNILDTLNTDMGVVQQRITDLETELHFTQSIHSNPGGCAKVHAEYVFPDIINIYEFLNPYSQDYIYTKNINFPQSFSTEAVGIGKLRLTTYTPNVHVDNESEEANRGIPIQEIPEMVTLNGTSIFDIRPRGFEYHGTWPDKGPGGLPQENWTAVWEGYLEFPIATKEKNKSRTEQHGFLILSNVNDAYAMELQDRDGKWIRVNEGTWAGGPSDYAARHGVVPTIDNVSNDQTTGLVRWLGGSGYPKDPASEPYTEEYVGWQDVYLPINPDEKRVYPLRMYLCNGGGIGEIKLWMKYTKEGKKYDAEYITSEAKVSDHKVLKHVTTTETDNLSEEIFIIPKHYFRLNAPELYEFRGAPFGSHDPIEAANKEMPNPVDINVFQSNLIVEEKPQSTAGYHYHSNNGSAPVDHKIPSDKWIDLGIDFTGVKLKLPVPHPTPPDPISDGILRSVHRFKHRDGGYKFKILNDGRQRQARNTDKNSEQYGFLLYDEDGFPITETLPNEQDSNTTWEDGWTWEGISFYAYDSKGVPENLPPEIRDIFIKYYDEEFEDGNQGEGWFTGVNGQPDGYWDDNTDTITDAANAGNVGVIPLHSSGICEWGASDKKYYISADAIDPDGGMGGEVQKMRIKVMESSSPKLVLDGDEILNSVGNYFGNIPNDGKLLYEGAVEEQKIYLPAGYSKLKVEAIDSRNGIVEKNIAIYTHTPTETSYEPMAFNVWNSFHGGNFKFQYRQQVIKGLKGFMTGTYNSLVGSQYAGYWAYWLGFKEGLARRIQTPEGTSILGLLNEMSSFGFYCSVIRGGTDSLPNIVGNEESDLKNWLPVGKYLYDFMHPSRSMRHKKWNRRTGHSPTLSHMELIRRGYTEFKRGYKDAIIPWYINEPSDLTVYGQGRNTDYSAQPYYAPPTRMHWQEKLWYNFKKNTTIGQFIEYFGVDDLANELFMAHDEAIQELSDYEFPNGNYP